VVADGLAGTGIPMGIVPEGTANLLSRNLGIPQNELEAITVALSGRTRAIDLVKLSVDGKEGEHFAVMAGMGIDAMIMDETNPELKAKIGSGAYFVAAAKALGRLPVPMRIRVDNHRVHRRRAMICVVGNVSTLAGNLVLIPGAKPDDGMLDCLRRLTAPVHPVGPGDPAPAHPPSPERGSRGPVAWPPGRGRAGEAGQLPAGRRRGRRAAPAGGRGAAAGAVGARSGLTGARIRNQNGPRSGRTR
jgi:hypothetical protein